MVAGRSAAKTRFLLKLALAKTPREALVSHVELRRVPDEFGDEVYVFERGGMHGEVIIEAHTDDESGFEDLYESVDGVGDSAAWGPTIHTLRVRDGARRIKVSLDLPFGSDPPEGALDLACEAARAALESH